MEPILRSAPVLKKEAEETGLQGKDIGDYVRQEQALDGEERVAWRDAQKVQPDIQMAEIQAVAEDAKTPKLPAFIDEKDELDSYLLHFECKVGEKHVGY